MSRQLQDLLNNALPETRHYLSDAIDNGDLDDAADDFVEKNSKIMTNKEAVWLCNRILEQLGQEPIFNE